ncbi:MAG: FlgD immunoglobulin-like domain containing protein [Candidatus Latescibacterota bacterium]
MKAGSRWLGAVLAAAGVLLAGPGGATELVVIGGAEGRPWGDGGGGTDPVIIVSSTEVTNQNAPGGVVDLTVRQGWMFPERADRTQNIARQLQARGGAVSAPSILEDLQAELVKMIDNDPNSAFERKVRAGRSANALGVVLELDLGARFGVSRLRFFPRNAAADYPAPDFPFQDDYLKAYEILLNDGTPETLAGGLPVFTSAVLVMQNDDPVVDVAIPPQYVRYVRVKSQTAVGFEIAEFQVFGEGFVPTAEFHSDIFDLGEGLALWGNLRWEEESIGDPIRSGLAISTRSGMDDAPVVFSRVRSSLDGAEVPWKAAADLPAGSAARELVARLDAPGLDVREARALYSEQPLAVRNEIALQQADYTRLKAAEKGFVRDDLENWSAWSPPYAAGQAEAQSVAAGQGGVPIVSPGPRRYFQFKVEYSSEELFSATGIGSLSFDLARPSLAEEIVAEIAPREAPLGTDTQFTLALIPSLRPGVDTGFSAVEISTPVRVSFVGRVEVRMPDGSRQEGDFADADLTQLPQVRGAFSLDRASDDGFRITFPRIAQGRVADGEMAILSLEFRCVVLRTGTAFGVQAFSSEAGSLPQRAVGGNALALSQNGAGTPLVRNPGSLVVLVQRRGGLLINAGASPRVITPNGDGVNDSAHIGFDITDLISGADVTLRIYDLAGRPVRQLDAGQYASGRYAQVWNGTDDHGDTVPPGVYVFRVEVDADAGGASTGGTVSVVY